MRQVDFLNITLDLTNDIYKPYKKPNNKTLYVNSKSNHPPTVIKGGGITVSLPTYYSEV